MKKNRNIHRRTRNRRGAALILTLVAIAIVATLAASVGNLVYSHQRSAEADRDNARALHLAEAALVLQVQKISASLREDYAQLAASYGTSNNKHDLTEELKNLGVPKFSHFLTTNNKKKTASVADLFRVDPGDGDDFFVAETWVLNTAASGQAGTLNIYSRAAAAAGQAIFSRATLYPKGNGSSLSGIQRTLRAGVEPTGVFDQWACFGINALYLRGSNITITGNIGTNEFIGKNETTKITGTQNVRGSITLHDEQFQLPGVSSTPVPGVFLAPARSPNPVPWPTVADIANQEAGYCKYGYGGPTPPPYRSSLPINPGGNPSDSGPVIFKTNNDHALAVYTDASGNRLQGIPQSSIPPGAKLTLKGAPYGANYYMTELNVGGSNGTIEVDSPTGSYVNLWIDSNNSSDEIRSSIPNNGAASSFRIYYSNRKGKLRLGAASGAMSLNAMIYAFDREPNKSTTGTVEVAGSVTLRGSLIANTLDLAGDNITVSHVANPRADPGEGILYFGLASPWIEVNTLREK